QPVKPHIQYCAKYWSHLVTKSVSQTHWLMHSTRYSKVNLVLKLLTSNRLKSSQKVKTRQCHQWLAPPQNSFHRRSMTHVKLSNDQRAQWLTATGQLMDVPRLIYRTP